MAEIKDYDVDANNNTATPPDGAAEGWAPSTVNNTIRELMARTKRLWEDTSAVNTTTGTSNAYLLSASQTISAYAAGDVFMFVADRANTGAATLAVDGLAAKSLKTVTQAELVAGQLTANGIYVAAYDTTNDVFQVLGVDESTGTMTLDSLSVDTISEKTAAAGVTIDGVLLKDNAVSATAASTVTVADASNEAVTITQTGNGGGVLIDDTGTGTALHVTNATAQAANTPVLEVGPSVTATATHGVDCMGMNVAMDAPGSAGTNFMLHAHVNSPSATNAYPGLLLSRTRGTTASPTQVDDNDGLGVLYFQAQNDTVGVAGLDSGAYIYAEVDETNVTIGSDGVPTTLRFYTNAGAGTPNFMEVAPESTGKLALAINATTTITGNGASAPVQIFPAGNTYALYAESTDSSVSSYLANNNNTFNGVGGILANTGPTDNYAATLSSESTAFGALLTYSQDDGTVMRLSHANLYTAYGSGGQIINYAADDTSGTYSFRAKNASGFDLLLARSDGQLYTGTQSKSPYNNTTASAANMFVSSGGILQRSTSSGRFKTNVQPLENEWADKILDLEPVFYESTASGDASNPDWTYYGLIAEDVAQVDGRYVHFDTGEREGEEELRNPETGELIRPARPARGRKPQAEWVPGGVQYERMVVPLINIAKRQRDRIEALETQVSDLTAQLSALADRVAALEA